MVFVYMRTTSATHTHAHSNTPLQDDDFLSPYLALTESFYNLSERIESKNLYKLPYQILPLPDFIVDTRTFKEKLFMVRLDLRTLAASVLGYKFVFAARTSTQQAIY